MTVFQIKKFKLINMRRDAMLFPMMAVKFILLSLQCHFTILFRWYGGSGNRGWWSEGDRRGDGGEHFKRNDARETDPIDPEAAREGRGRSISMTPMQPILSTTGVLIKQGAGSIISLPPRCPEIWWCFWQMPSISRANGRWRKGSGKSKQNRTIFCQSPVYTSCQGEKHRSNSLYWQNWWTSKLD